MLLRQCENVYILYNIVNLLNKLCIFYSLANELSDGFVERTSAPVQTIYEICWTGTADQRPQGCSCKMNEIHGYKITQS